MESMNVDFPPKDFLEDDAEDIKHKEAGIVDVDNVEPDSGKFAGLDGDGQQTVIEGHALTLLLMGGGAIKTQVCFNVLFDPEGVKIERSHFATFPKWVQRPR